MSEIDFTSSGQRVVVEETPRAIVKSLAPVVEGAVRGVEGAVRGAAQRDIKKTVATVKTGLRATFNELQAKQAEIEEREAEGAPVAEIEALSQEIKAIRLGQSQGRLTTSAGMARINKRVSELSNAFPAFAGDFRRLSAGLTGRTSGADLSPELSFEEQLAEKAEILERNLTINRGLNPDRPSHRILNRLLLQEETEREQLRFAMAQRAELRAIAKAGREAAGELRAEAAARRAADAATRAAEFRDNKEEVANLTVNSFVDRTNTAMSQLNTVLQGQLMNPDQVTDITVAIKKAYRQAMAEVNQASLTRTDKEDLIDRLSSTRDAALEVVDELDLAQAVDDELTFTNNRFDLNIAKDFGTAALIKRIYGTEGNLSSTIQVLQILESTQVGRDIVTRTGRSLVERYMAPWEKINGENLKETVTRWKAGGGNPIEWPEMLQTIRMLEEDIKRAP
jgi:hypothetical protein